MGFNGTITSFLGGEEMTDLESLYAGICAQPDEDTPRLVLADWLDEQGGKDNQFRADFIRTHCGWPAKSRGRPRGER